MRMIPLTVDRALHSSISVAACALLARLVKETQPRFATGCVEIMAPARCFAGARFVRPIRSPECVFDRDVIDAAAEA